jgi:hypothetical protein
MEQRSVLEHPDSSGSGGYSFRDRRVLNQKVAGRARALGGDGSHGKQGSLSEDINQAVMLVWAQARHRSMVGWTAGVAMTLQPAYVFVCTVTL